MPSRIQRSRAAGWRMPPGAIYVGRPGPWGNPFPVDGGWQASFRAVFLGFRGDKLGQTKAAVWIHKQWLTGEWRQKQKDNRSWFEREVMTVKAPPAPSVDAIRAALTCHDLACWCGLCAAHKDGLPFGVNCADCAPCHGDTLGVLANA